MLGVARGAMTRLSAPVAMIVMNKAGRTSTPMRVVGMAGAFEAPMRWGRSTVGRMGGTPGTSVA